MSHSEAKSLSNLNMLVKDLSENCVKISVLAENILENNVEMKKSDRTLYLLNLEDALKVHSSVFLHDSNVVFVKAGSVEEFKTKFSKVDIPINSNVYTVVGDYETKIDIWDVYRPAANLEIRLKLKRKVNIKRSFRATKWGLWRADSNLEVLHLDKWILRSDLTGVHFETGTIAQSPFVIVDDVDKNNLPRGYKVSDFQIPTLCQI